MDGNHEKILYMLGEMSSDLKTIKEQTVKTNGRVNNLEAKVQEHSDFILTLKTKVMLVSSAISLVGVVAWETLKNKIGQLLS